MKGGVAAAALVAAVFAAAPASAQNRPPITPTRDVDVTYRIAGPDAPLEQRMRWGVTLGKLRVDPPSPGMFVIIDTVTHAMQAVREGDRSVLLMHGGAESLPGVAKGGAFIQRGEARVAGLACTDWETKDTGGRTVLACLTADGVLLRAQANGLVLLQATSVRFEPQAEAVFRVPADYRTITMPPPPSHR